MVVSLPGTEAPSLRLVVSLPGTEAPSLRLGLSPNLKHHLLDWFSPYLVPKHRRHDDWYRALLPPFLVKKPAGCAVCYPPGFIFPIFLCDIVQVSVARLGFNSPFFPMWYRSCQYCHFWIYFPQFSYVIQFMSVLPLLDLFPPFFPMWYHRSCQCYHFWIYLPVFQRGTVHVFWGPIKYRHNTHWQEE